MDVELQVNGEPVAVEVPDRESLADTLRDRLRLTGTHLGCEQGVCGTCSVVVDGAVVRSCLLLTGQAGGAEVWTVEGLSPPCGLSPLQRDLAEEHGLQCGFCTPGVVVAATEFLASVDGTPTEAEIREAMSGNLCRCTGYDGIVRAVARAAETGIELPDGLRFRPPGASTGELDAPVDLERLGRPADADPVDPSPMDGPGGDTAPGSRLPGWLEVAGLVAGALVGAALRQRRARTRRDPS